MHEDQILNQDFEDAFDTLGLDIKGGERGVRTAFFLFVQTSSLSTPPPQVPLI